MRTVGLVKLTLVVGVVSVLPTLSPEQSGQVTVRFDPQTSLVGEDSH